MTDIKLINEKQLTQLINDSAPNYSSRSEGYALVNTLPEEAFKEEHIARSINVPQDRLEELKQHFDPEKKLIVYCASKECESSSKAARKLQELGFDDVSDFEGGLKAWKQINGPTESGMKQPEFSGEAASV